MKSSIKQSNNRNKEVNGMGNTVRFGISLDEKLLANFDQLIEQKSYMNRSEAIRDLIRATLVEERLGSEEQEAVGTVTLVYNHHVRDLSEKLTEHQHSHHDQIVSALHVHLDAHNCLEVLVIRGTVRDIRQIADELIGVKGVKHGKLVMTTTGIDL
jgi:CopG family nickel-responsive transcriptional regulator